MAFAAWRLELIGMSQKRSGSGLEGSMAFPSFRLINRIIRLDFSRRFVILPAFVELLARVKVMLLLWQEYAPPAFTRPRLSASEDPRQR